MNPLFFSGAAYGEDNQAAAPPAAQKNNTALHGRDGEPLQQQNPPVRPETGQHQPLGERYCPAASCQAAGRRRRGEHAFHFNASTPVRVS